MNWIDSHIRVNINRLLFADDLLLRASSELAFNVRLIGFQLRSIKRKWKLALKIPSYYVSPEIQVSVSRGLKLKLLRGPHEDLKGNPRAALWRGRNSRGTWTY